MNENTISNWDNTDHKAIYTRQLAENPVYYNEDLKLRVTYSYEYCKAILTNDDARIPEPVIENDSPLNDIAKLLIKKLARITNNKQHQESRQAALIIYQCIKPVPVDGLLENLLAKIPLYGFDWVEAVGKRLPVLLILKGMGFAETECDYVVENISSLVRVMSPNKTADDVTAINKVVNEFYEIAIRYVKTKFPNYLSENIELFAFNLLGLFIQCYDAGRGLLCNALINMVTYHQDWKMYSGDKAYFKRLITETLRFDPPVHNTRRVAVKDILIGSQLIKAGEQIMVIMAAANLDPSVFEKPELYNTFRSNNEQHITFGLGGHNCIAKYLTIDIVVDTCSYLANKYEHIALLQQEFKYEAALNVRLVKELTIKLS